MRLFARTNTTFINPQQIMLSTENAIISNMALTYRGSSPAEKKYGLLFPLSASVQSHCRRICDCQWLTIYCPLVPGR
jgi:hypothetical protein